MINEKKYLSILQQIENKATLVAVSKGKSLDEIQQLYRLGQRDFGENRVQELLTKYEALPKDIRWHMIGHLQSNKVKYIAPFVHLIHSVESIELAIEIDRQANICGRAIPCLLQVKVAQEENKYGLSQDKVIETLIAFKNLSNINIQGLMALATNTKNNAQVKSEFGTIHKLQTELMNSQFLPLNSHLSIGMSTDWQIALHEGATMVRIGSLLFYPVDN